MDTGIVRKIDDLGRIVIPKELLKSNNIEPFDDFIIGAENGNIVLKKYSPYTKYSAFLKSMLLSIDLPDYCYIAVCTQDQYITNGVSGKVNYEIPCRYKSIASAIQFAIRNSNGLESINMVVQTSVTQGEEHKNHFAKKVYVVPNRGAIVIIKSGDRSLPEFSKDIEKQIKFALRTMRNIKE